jgi:hypothetical protein
MRQAFAMALWVAGCLRADTLPPHAEQDLARSIYQEFVEIRSGYTQHCSLNNPDLLGEVDPTSALRLARAKRVLAHFALDAARIQALATGTDALLENLLEHGFMEGFSVPRGEER